MTREDLGGGSPPAGTRARSFAGWLIRTWPKGTPTEVRAIAAFRYREDALFYTRSIPPDTSYSITPQNIEVREEVS